jgi:hypothetical protein
MLSPVEVLTGPRPHIDKAVSSVDIKTNGAGCVYPSFYSCNAPPRLLLTGLSFLEDASVMHHYKVAGARPMWRRHNMFVRCIANERLSTN